MAENQINNNSDEIDLGQLFQLIGKGFTKLFNTFLRLFLFLKKSIFILGGLVIVGLAAGYGLNKVISKKLKTEVIVKPNLESKNYLYDVIDEIQSNIKAKDTSFFKNIGITNINFKGLEVEIARVDGDVSSESDLKYLELLQSFDNTEVISDILRAELQNKSSFNHRITVFHKDSNFGQSFAKGIMEYINKNEYFDGLTKIYRTNAKSRIEENKTLLKQVDELIANYSKKMAQEDKVTGNERIVLDNQEKLNITGLFNLKNNLIKDIEAKKIELQKQTDPIKVINFGKTRVVEKSFFGKSLVLIPILLLSLFFLISILRFFNRKAMELNS
jgi:hypothetical protein